MAYVFSNEFVRLKVSMDYGMLKVSFFFKLKNYQNFN